MKGSQNFVALIFAIAFCQPAVVFGQSSGGVGTALALDWTERQDPNANLKAHDDTLLGDSIDLQSGRLSFEQVDVSLPGNFRNLSNSQYVDRRRPSAVRNYLVCMPGTLCQRVYD